jgi:hypothetical protein
MKATRATIQARVEQVLRIRLAGAEFWDIRQYAAEEDPDTGRPWNVSARQLWRYIAAADNMLAQQLEKNRTKCLNRHIATRRALLARATQVGDYRTALAVARDEAELLGLYDLAKGQGESTPPPLANAQDVAAALADVITQLRSGQLDPRLSATLGQLATVLLRAQEQGTLEQRLAALEAARDAQIKGPGP